MSIETAKARLLKRYDAQVNRIFRCQEFRLVGMHTRDFTAQAFSLKQRLSVIPEIPSGDIALLVCLPSTSLYTRTLKTTSGNLSCVCERGLRNCSECSYSNTLHVLLGVCDGRNRVLPTELIEDPHFARIEQVFAEEDDRDSLNRQHPITASAGLELLRLYPNLIHQHAILTSGTIDGAENATVIWFDWINRKRIVVGSAGGKEFKKIKGKLKKISVASYAQMYTPFGVLKPAH